MNKPIHNWFRSAFIALSLMVISLPAWTMELVMIEQDICPFCKLFDDQVGAEYSTTEAGKRAPLRRVDLKGEWPEDLKGIRRDQLTPSFILVDDGKEIGRLRGYPGRDEFWELLQKLLDKKDSQ